MDFIDLKTQYRQIQAEVDANIRKVLEHGQYILGPEVGELERRLAEFVGTKHCVSVASGTDALLVAMMALGISAGDEVITTPFTFIATGEMIMLLGAKPVFVDIDPRTYNIDPSLIEASITLRTKAIIPVSLYGQCAEFDAINAVADKHGIPVIEDGAQSFGATYKERRSCALSTIGCTSFFPSKPLGCYGDGGACFTDDDKLAKAMREIRVHGQDRRYHHPIIGINGRMDTLQAAILLAKLNLFYDELVVRERIGKNYSRLLADTNSSIKTPYVEPYNTSVYAQFTIEVDHRSQVLEGMTAAGIPTAVHYPVPLHLQPAFQSLGVPDDSLTHSERAAQRVMSLPMHPYLGSEEQKAVVAALQACCVR
jgi:UDP-2-acetamido-2-deoxy-ribo-hexuluronate aminotransferase